MRSAIAGCLLVAFAGCGEGSPSASAPADASASEPVGVLGVPVDPLAVGPVKFFQDYCARCHGEYGWSYRQGYTAHLSDDELLEVVRGMVIGPAQQSLGERELRALADLHKAIDAGDAGRFAARVAGGDIDALPNTEDAEALLEGRGAWAGVGASGRVFGEIDPGE